MGLFDSLKKGIDAVAKEVEAHKDDIEKFANDVKAQVGVQNNNAPAQQSYSYATPQSAAEKEKSSFPEMGVARDQFDRFDSIIKANFADCEVRSNVSASELDSSAHPKCKPVSFMFYKNGVPVLAVVLVRANTHRGMNVIGTKQIVEAKGIKYLRFYEEYDNEESYVVNRIKQNL